MHRIFNATQMVLPVLHLDFTFYFGKFGVLCTDYENMFSMCNHFTSQKRNSSVANTNSFVFSYTGFTDGSGETPPTYLCKHLNVQ